MPPTPLSEAARSNLAAVRVDLAAARTLGDAARAALLEALIDSGGSVIIYRPDRQHFGVLFGDVGRDRHVAVVVPGVGDGVNLRTDWLPSARNLFEAAEATAVILWKAYDNPPDLLRAAVRSIECDASMGTAAADLAAFVASLPVGPEQTVTVVAHSFGSTVTVAALADCGLTCTDVVVVGSPGLTVDDLRQLHLDAHHFFSEEAPEDTVAELGIFGADPTSATFGGTRMRTNAPGHVEVRHHSSYFVPGSAALENIVDVVTGRYAGILAHRPSIAETAGSAVAWILRLPTVPVVSVGRRYRGPGFRVLVNARRLVDFTSTRAGDLVRDALITGETAVTWMVARCTGGVAPPL